MMTGSPTHAQPTTKSLNPQTQFWTSINSTFRLSERWGMMGDFHLRRNNFVAEPNFYFLRLGGVYWLDERFSLAGGAAALWLYNHDAFLQRIEQNYSLERRSFQQILWRSPIRKMVFSHRIRTEQRWHEVLNLDNGAVDRIRLSHRFRFLFSASFPLFASPKLPRLVLADEVHFHVGEEIVYNTFDQNRSFVGISQRINPNLRFDLGYMLVYQQRYSGFEYDLNHTLRFFFYYSPDFRKDGDLPHYSIPGDE